MSGPDDRVTFAPYSPEEAGRLREAVRAGVEPLVCPRCGGRVTSGPPIAGGGTVGSFWLLRCDACQRGVTLSDLPGPRS